MVFIQHDSYNDPVYLTLSSNNYTTAINNLKSDLIFELQRPIVCSSNVNVYMNVESFKFTNSIYNVNQYNNIFYFGLSPSYTEASIAIPSGNYSITRLVSWMNSYVGNNFAFEYDETYMKIIITNSTDEFKIFSSSNNILKVLGFTPQTHTSTSLTLTSDKVINLLGSQILYLTTPGLSYVSYGVKGATQNNILMTIPITAIQGDSQTVHSSYRHKLNETVINFININIRDDNDNEVDFNNIDWYLSLNFIFSYKKQYIPPATLNDFIQKQTITQVNNDEADGEVENQENQEN